VGVDLVNPRALALSILNIIITITADLKGLNVTLTVFVDILKIKVHHKQGYERTRVEQQD